MARDSGGGGGGAFGWTLLGILVGVAATLAVQTLVNSRRASPVVAEAPVSSARLPIQVAPPVVKPVVKAPASAVVAPKAPAAMQSQEDVEDDAAAAGMTSRTRPSEAQNGPGPAPN
jgi:hypothetical protein